MAPVTTTGAARPRPASVHAHPRAPAQPEVAVPARFHLDAPNRADGLELLRALPADAFPLVVLDPQYMAETVEGEGGCGEPEAGREVA